MAEKNELMTLEEFELPDLNLPAAMEIRDSVLNIDDLPDRASIVIGLRALGYNTGRIAEIVGCCRQTVTDYIKRYDPQGKCIISQEDRRLITTQMMQSTAVEALMSITHEKLKNTNARNLADIAVKCATAVEKLNLSKKIGDSISSSRVHSMIEALDVGEEE